MDPRLHQRRSLGSPRPLHSWIVSTPTNEPIGTLPSRNRLVSFHEAQYGDAKPMRKTMTELSATKRKPREKVSDFYRRYQTPRSKINIDPKRELYSLIEKPNATYTSKLVGHSPPSVSKPVRVYYEIEDDLARFNANHPRETRSHDDMKKITDTHARRSVARGTSTTLTTTTPSSQTGHRSLGSLCQNNTSTLALLL